MRKIIVANRKGGTGKSTTSVHLAAGLAKVGSSVLLIDTDAQGNCSKMLGQEPISGLSELIAKSVSPEEAIIEARPNLSLLSGSHRLAGTTRIIAREDFDSQYVLTKALEPYEGKYDFVVLDTAPGYSPMSMNVLFYGNEILVPINMEVLSVQGFIDFMGELEPVRERAGVAICYVLPTMADGRKGLTAEIIAQLETRFPAQVCEPIHYAARMSEIPRKGVTIYEEDDSARPAVDYAKLTRRILKDGKT